MNEEQDHGSPKRMRFKACNLLLFAAYPTGNRAVFSISVGGFEMALSKTTQDHEEIRHWAEARGAVPAEVTSTHRKNEPGVLRFCFPNAKPRNNQSLNKIPWDDFFEKFDSNDLELVYQEKTASGQRSNFNKLVYPEGKSRSTSRSSRRTSTKSSGSRSSSSKSSETGSHRRAA